MKGELKPRPFCGSTNLDFSSKVFGKKRFESSFHVCIYCKSCNCYGRRLIVNTNNTILTAEEKEEAEKKAIKLWNERAKI